MPVGFPSEPVKEVGKLTVGPGVFPRIHAPVVMLVAFSCSKIASFDENDLEFAAHPRT